MQTIGGIFGSPRAALDAVAALRKAGVAEKDVDVLMPGSDASEFANKIDQIRDKTGPGAWSAVGAGIGSFAGAAIVSAAVPGIGPVLGLGALAAAFLAGGLGGKAAGDAIEHTDVQDDHGDDTFVFTEALRREKAVVIVRIHGGDPMTVSAIFGAAGGQSLDTVRDNWWRESRDKEARHYEALGHGDFGRDEPAYRRGFEAGSDWRYNGRAFEQVAVKLRPLFHDDEESAFRRGFERAAEVGWGKRDEVTKTNASPSGPHSQPSLARAPVAEVTRPSVPSVV